MKIDNSLAKVFDIDVIENTESNNNIANIVINDDSEYKEKVEQDYNKIRNNLNNLLETGQDALYTMIEIAKNSESGKDFAIVGNMIKQLSEINTQLMINNEKKQKIDQLLPGQNQGNITNTTINNNAVFVGSTSELSKMIKNMKLDNK